MDKNSCLVCQRTDADDKEGGDLWIMCSTQRCAQWYHIHCVGLESCPPKKSPWYCNICKESLSNNILNQQTSNSYQINNNNLHENQLGEAASKREELKLLSELIREKEEIHKLKIKQLNLMEQLSQTSKLSNVKNWLKENQNQEGERIIPNDPEFELNNGERECKISNTQHSSKNVNQNQRVDESKSLTVSSETDVMSLFKTHMQLMSRQYLEELPEFSGDPEMWPIFFRQYFETTKQGGFDDAHNLCRLRKCLKGEARNAVRGVLSLPNALEDVIKILQNRFGRVDLIVKRKLKSLKEIAAPNDNRPMTVVRFYEFLQDLLATLVNADAKNYIKSPQTLDAVVEKLPPSISRSWIKYQQRRDFCTIYDFMEFFESYYECALQAEPEQPRDVTYDHKKKTGRVYMHNENESTDKSNEAANQCKCCRKMDHTIVNCDEFRKLTIFKRWQLVRKRGLCFKCLITKHSNKICNEKIKCDVNGCKESNHVLLHQHREMANSIPSLSTAPVNANSIPSSAAPVNIQSDINCNKTYFRVIPVTLYNPIKRLKVTTWAFLDEGSSPTMLSEELAKKLEIDGIKEELCTTWTDSTIRKDKNSRRVTIEISGSVSSKKYKLTNVRTVTQLNLPVPDFDIQHLKKKYIHLNDVDIPSIPKSRPGILIGLEHSKLGIMYEIREGSWNEPIASRTRLGWAIHGKEMEGATEEFSCYNCECHNEKTNDTLQTLHESVKYYFTTESFGVNVPKQALESDDIIHARELLKTTTTKITDCYETGLLWKQDKIVLPDNMKVAYKRLVCFEQKLLHDPSLLASVSDKIESHISNKYLVKLTKQEVNEIGDHRWFLPIFAVRNQNKPAKIRLVFDAASKCNGVSLNDVLSTGPDLLTSLFGVLLRFREGKIAVAADIAEMFHRIKIIEPDQKYQLILWRNADTTKSPDVYKTTCMTFGATCSPSSAQFVKNINALQYSEKFPRAVESITNRHYVDDLLDSFDSEAEAISVSETISFIHAQGGFNIRNWLSNSSKLMRVMNASQNSGEEEVDLNISTEIITEKVLGLYWCITTDDFSFKLNFNKLKPDIINKLKTPTKREILKLVMSLFDPVGFLATITVCAKIIMQDVWRSGIDWDERITEDLVTRWFNWLDALKDVVSLRIPRCLSLNLMNADRVELHLFADASEDAFAVAAYLRISRSEIVDVSFVTAKTKVAPQKGLTINRLELQGCVMATRLKDTLTAELSIKIHESIFWTDSQTALGWIRSVRRKYGTFVSHRIGEILQSSNVNQWRWVPSSENIADDATRGVEHPVVSLRWFNGPTFLKNGIEFWPKEKNRISTTDEEAKPVYAHRELANPYDNIKLQRFSKWERLVRTTAFVIRYVSILHRRVAQKSSAPIFLAHVPVESIIQNVPALESQEISEAESILFRKSQRECFLEELLCFENAKPIPKVSPIFNLNPYLAEDHLIRLDTRLDVTPSVICADIKRPILLAREHYATILFIEAVHRKLHHAGLESVVNYIRQRFWIPKIRVVCRKVLAGCSLCAIRRAKPNIPRMSNLPEQRLSPFKPPFTMTGMDYFGPLDVTIGRRHEKRWGVIFTCLSSRAIHLELASSLNTSSAILSIRNFKNRRGTPEEMFSDNGTNLRAAEKELRLAVKELCFETIKDETADFTSSNGIHMKWTFIPPTAAHFGGVWERMIRTVKTSLYVILKSKAPKEETLRSALIEIENIVNSRPLTYSSTDVNSPIALTPNHLLRGTAQNVTQFDGEIDSRRQWLVSQAIADEFWKRWLKEYLPTISHRTKWLKESPAITIDQLVLIIDDNLPRNDWRRGIVKATYPSRDGRIRSVQVQTAKGTFDRPVSKLAIINAGNAFY